MAKNWTIHEAWECLRNGDKAGVLDFGKRFPIATMAVSRIATADAEMLLAALPSHLTMRKVEIALKDGVKVVEEEDEEVMTPEQDKAARAEKAAKKAAAKKPAKKAEKEPEPEEEDQENPYEGKSPKELFMLCKKRGIAVKPNMKAVYYVNKLNEQDTEGDTQDDEWDEAEEEEVKKPAKKAPAAKKPAKKAEPEDSDDEDEDWDI